MPDIDKFNNIAYLATGNNMQKQVHSLLTRYRVIEGLIVYTPLLVGTIPIDIAIESSDLDIICCYNDLEKFENNIHRVFNSCPEFVISKTMINNQQTIVAGFRIENWPIEIFGQQVPTKQQNGYRHMIAEYKLLKKYGEDFRKQIIHFKEQGFKTEPAFAKALNLKGDPYLELLKYY